MGQLLRPGEHEMKGPWLLSEAAILELDAVITSIGTKISKANENYITENPRTQFSPTKRYNETDEELELRQAEFIKTEAERAVKLTTQVIVTDKKDIKIIDTSLKSLLRDSQLKEFKATNLSIELSGDYDMPSRFKASFNKFGDKVTYTAKAHNSNIIDDVIYDFEVWLEKYKPTKSREVWNRFSFPITMFFAILSFLLVSPMFETVTTNYVDYKNIYRNEVIQYIKSGINKDNQAKALESLMKYEIDYTPTKAKVETVINKTILRIFILSIITAIVAAYQPINIIGIGDNKGKLKRYNLYTKIVLVTIPSAFILPFLYSTIRVLLGIK
jgi:hypothetical protein